MNIHLNDAVEEVVELVIRLSSVLAEFEMFHLFPGPQVQVEIESARIFT